MLTLFLLAALAVIDRASTHVEQEDDLLSFSYAWPAEINDVPALRAIILAEAAAEQAQARRWAREGRAGRGSTFNGHSYAKGWEMRGSNSQLISLAAGQSSYTGGAHGNQNFSVLLWDRAAQRSVSAAEILGADVVERLKPRYCAALDLDRAERRGEPVRPDPEDSFTICPDLAEQKIAPVDTDDNGRFDRIDILIAPYGAGPWVEGEYIIEIPLIQADIGGLSGAFATAFESGPAPTVESRGE